MLSNDQPPVAHYRQIAPAREVDVARCLSTETLAAYAHELAEWVLGRESVLAPLVLPPPALTHWQQFNSNTVHKKSQSGSRNSIFSTSGAVSSGRRDTLYCRRR